jgi:hypothetical protein
MRVKGKVVPLPKHHTLKAYKGKGGKTARILDLGTSWRSGHFHVLAALLLVPTKQESSISTVTRLWGG